MYELVVFSCLLLYLNTVESCRAPPSWNDENTIHVCVDRFRCDAVLACTGTIYSISQHDYVNVLGLYYRHFTTLEALLIAILAGGYDGAHMCSKLGNHILLDKSCSTQTFQSHIARTSLNPHEQHVSTDADSLHFVASQPLHA
jgi:hypothetical protein